MNVILDEKLMAKRRLGNNMQPPLLITSGQMGLLSNHVPIIMHNQLPNILPPLPQHIHMKSKMELVKTKSQLGVEKKSLQRGPGGSSLSASNI